MIYQSTNSGSNPIKSNIRPANSLVHQLFHNITVSNIRTICSYTSIALVLILSGTHSPVSHGAALDHLAQAQLADNFDKQSKTTKLISYLVDKSHFKNVPLDDKFSEKILERYIDQLDPAKSFFLQEDIDQFMSINHEFDDYIKHGTLEPVYAIFKVFRTRVNQRIEYALARLEQPFDFTLDEQFLVDLEDAQWAKNEEELNEYWRKRIKNDLINLRLSSQSEGDSSAKIIDTLNSRYTHIARRTRQFNTDDVFQNFINAYVSTIEPHTSYYSPRGAENFKIHMRLSLEGIGAVLQTENEYTLVRRIIPGGPADVAGELKSEDRIIGVGQENKEVVDVIGWRLDDVVDLIRGPKGSVVSLDILPGAYGVDAKPETITIVRDKIKLEEQAARKRILEINTGQTQSSIGVINLPSFYSDFDGKSVSDPNYRSTTRDVRRLLGELKEEDIDGLIIDLRGNGGGALTEAISLTGLFIRTGPVVQVQNSNGRIQVDRDQDPEIVYDGPLAVLVDQYSASASEIFAGAIQDYGRGLIVGEPTFGKGTVQNLVDLNRFINSDEDLGQLKVTIAQFFRINGDSTQHRGVIPDITWHTAEQDIQSGERSYENAIPWRHVDKASFVPFQSAVNPEILDQTVSRHLSRVKNNPEFDYILEVNRINKINRETKHITLNEEQRRVDRNLRDQERLELENRRRKSQGDPTFDSIELLDAEQQDFSENDENNPRGEEEPDLFLVESGKILADFSYFKTLSANAFTDTELVKQNLPDTTGLLNN
jgi:carboxyl-terminal processing protease